MKRILFVLTLFIFEHGLCVSENSDQALLALLSFGEETVRDCKPETQEVINVQLEKTQPFVDAEIDQEEKIIQQVIQDEPPCACRDVSFFHTKEKLTQGLDFIVKQLFSPLETNIDAVSEQLFSDVLFQLNQNNKLLGKLVDIVGVNEKDKNQEQLLLFGQVIKEQQDQMQQMNENFMKIMQQVQQKEQVSNNEVQQRVVPQPMMNYQSLNNSYGLRSTEPNISVQANQSKQEMASMLQELKYELQMQQMKNKYELLTEMADITYSKKKKRAERDELLTCFAKEEPVKQQSMPTLQETLDSFKKDIRNEIAQMLKESQKQIAVQNLLKKNEAIVHEKATQKVALIEQINGEQEDQNQIIQSIDINTNQTMNEVAQLKNPFVVKFKELDGYNRQQMLNLLGLEVSLVGALFSDQKGYEIESLMQQRNTILNKSNTVIRWMYSAILQKATSDTSSIAKLQSYTQQTGDNKLWSALYRDDRKRFLFVMKQVLDFYYGLLQDTNFELSIDA